MTNHPNRGKGKPRRAARNIAWIEKFCRVPEGAKVGEKIKLRPWQKDDLRKIYDNPAGTRRAIISFGKKERQDQSSGVPVVVAGSAGLQPAATTRAA